jgi:hypothetical protein
VEDSLSRSVERPERRTTGGLVVLSDKLGDESVHRV